GLLDGFDVCTDQLDLVLVQNAVVRQLDSQVERGLSTDSGKNGESCAGRELALDANNLLKIFAVQRLDVSAVGKLRIGHNGGRVRVGQHHFVSLGLERLAGLSARVVELGGLPDDDRPRAEDEDFGNVSTFGHGILVVGLWSSVVGVPQNAPAKIRDAL